MSGVTSIGSFRVTLCSIALLAALVTGMDLFAQRSVDQEWMARSPMDQRDEVVLVTAFNQGTFGFAELGIGRNIGATGHLPVDVGYYLGGEMRVDDPEHYGLKFGFYLMAVVEFGSQFIYYRTPEDDPFYVWRPEIGFGLLKARVTYAYNVKLAGDRLPGFNTHMLTVAYALRLFRLPGDSNRR
jgi:hypothetical protein